MDGLLLKGIFRLPLKKVAKEDVRCNKMETQHIITEDYEHYEKRQTISNLASVIMIVLMLIAGFGFYAFGCFMQFVGLW